MNDDERLREALLELDVLRRREAERSRESGAILSALEAMATTKDASDGITPMLASIEGALDCGLVALFALEADALHLRYPDRAPLQDVRWVAPGLTTKRRRIVDLHEVVGLWETPPTELASQRSLISVPISEGEQRMVMIAFSPERGAFKAADADLLQRLATIASQAIIQRALEEHSAFLSAVIDASPISVAIAEAKDDLPLVYVNAAFTTLTGYAPSEVLGQNCRFMSVEPAGSEVRAAIRETVSNKTEGQFVVKNKRKSGEEFWNELRLFPIRDSNGEARQIVATQIDSTQRINAEIERDNVRLRMESALSATSEGFMIIGARSTIRFANAVFNEFFGNDAFQVNTVFSAHGLAVLLDDPTLVATDDPLDHLQREVNREIKSPNGQQLLLRARPMRGGGAVVAATDVTQTKVNERILRQRLAAIEMSQDGIAIGDPDGRVLHANPSLVALWGLPSEAYGLGRKWINFYDAPMRDRFAAHAAQYDRTGVWRDEVLMTTDAGERVHDVSLSRVPEVGTVLVVRDITERQQEEEDRNRLQRQLDSARMQDHLNQLSAGLAHDFNNLLSAILGSASLINMLDDVPEQAETAANRIKLAAEKAAGLVDGFLDLGMRERKPERLDLGEVILTTVDLARAGAPANAQLNTSICPETVWVSASQTDLLQALMNLIVNGLDALDGRTGEVRITLAKPDEPDPSLKLQIGSIVPGTRYALIRVQDTGKGMDADTIARMLEPYFTTKGNQGSGLGLAIVLSTLNANGCLMTLESVENEGATFTIYWPVDDVRMMSRALHSNVHSNRNGLPILVVDDQPEVASAIARDLTAAGFEVAETTDPEAALETILEDRDGWGCLITDYDMPGLSGGDIVARLAQDAPEVPVIVVSALAKRIADPRVTAAKAVLSKPVNRSTLVKTLNAALNAGETEIDDADSAGR